MPFSGVHIACGYVGDRQRRSDPSQSLQRTRPTKTPLMQRPLWSQTFAANAPGSTTAEAPYQGSSTGSPSFEIATSIEIFVAIGSAPDASQANGAGNTARILVPAGGARNLYCDKGDRLAWVAA